MEEGYRVIEPSLISPLLREGKYDDYGVAILHWLIQELYIEQEDQLTDVKIEVIRVEYFGAYPALGLRYPSLDFEMEALVVSPIRN